METVAARNAPRGSASSPRQLRILMVDDDPDLVLSLTALLRIEAYDVRGLHHAGDIVRQLKDYAPDVVILDIAMPGKNGWDAAQEIRADPSGRRPVLVGMSGEYTHSGVRAFSQARGFDFYLTKPCDPEVLLTLLRWVGIQSPVRTAFL